MAATSSHHPPELQKIAQLLVKGRHDAAYPLLKDFLRENPTSQVGWRVFETIKAPESEKSRFTNEVLMSHLGDVGTKDPVEEDHPGHQSSPFGETFSAEDDSDIISAFHVEDVLGGLIDGGNNNEPAFMLEFIAPGKTVPTENPDDVPERIWDILSDAGITELNVGDVGLSPEDERDLVEELTIDFDPRALPEISLPDATRIEFSGDTAEVKVNDPVSTVPIDRSDEQPTTISAEEFWGEPELTIIPLSTSDKEPDQPPEAAPIEEIKPLTWVEVSGDAFTIPTATVPTSAPEITHPVQRVKPVREKKPPPPYVKLPELPKKEPAAPQRRSWRGAGIGALALLMSAIVIASFLLGRFVYVGKESARAAQLQATEAAAVAVVTEVPEPTALPTLSPVPTDTPPPTAIPTLEGPPQPLTAEEISAIMGSIQSDTLALRSLPNEEPLFATILPAEDWLAFLKNIQATQDPQVDYAAQTLVWEHLGWIPSGYNVERAVLAGYTDSFMGAYLPWEARIYLMDETFAKPTQLVYAYEVLQGQSLKALGPSLPMEYPLCLNDVDSCWAFSALLKGDAVAHLRRWQVDNPAQEDDLEDVLQFSLGEFSQGEFSQGEGAEAPADAPPFFQAWFDFIQYDGERFANELISQGGIAQLDSAYRKLPTTSEQVLHVDKYLAGEGPMALTTLPVQTLLGNEWAVLRMDQLGEFGTKAVLSAGADVRYQISEVEASRAAAGWGADRYQVLYNRWTNQSVLVVQWRWDTPQDEVEFMFAMGNYLRTRFADGQVSAPADGGCWEGSGKTSCVLNVNGQILWITAPEMDLVQDIVYGAN